MRYNKYKHSNEKNINIGKNVVIYPNVNLGNNVHIKDGAVIGCIPKSSGATKRNVPEKPGKVKIEDNCIIGCNAVIYTGVTIGKNSMVCDLASIREGCVIGEYSLIARGVTINYNTIVGNHVKIMDNTHITGNMVIEDNVFISTLVATVNDNSLGRGKTKVEDMKGPIIRKGAGIGAGAILLPNIEIGESSIVGAGAVVTKDVPPYTLVMGVPARVARKISQD